MKIKPEHYIYMQRAIEALPIKTLAAISDNVKNDPRVKDVAMRIRWDICHAACLGRWICDNVYTYADDAHVDTALRHIIDRLQ